MITNEIYHIMNYGLQFFECIVAGWFFILATNTGSDSYQKNNSQSRVFCTISDSNSTYSFLKITTIFKEGPMKNRVVKLFCDIGCRGQSLHTTAAGFRCVLSLCITGRITRPFLLLGEKRFKRNKNGE